MALVQFDRLQMTTHAASDSSDRSKEPKDQKVRIFLFNSLFDFILLYFCDIVLDVSYRLFEGLLRTVRQHGKAD